MRINSTDFQNSFGRYLSLCEKEDIIITKNGKSVAKLVAYTDPLHFYINEAKEEYNVRRRISYEEYLEYVDSSDQRYELIDGEIYLLASPSFKHQVLVRDFTLRLHEYLENSNCQVIAAPFDVRLHGHAPKFEEDPNVVQPDLLVICDPENITEDGKYEGIPTLVVEVLSPSTRRKDLVTKLNLYSRSGVKEYWIIDPDKNQVWQYTFDTDRDLDQMQVLTAKDQLTSSSFPDFSLELTDIFTK